MKVLVTGGEGQLGRCIVERAKVMPNIDLVAITRKQLDLTRRRVARPLIASIAPDVVINAAAFTAVDQAESHPDLAFAVNADGAGEVAAAAAAIEVPVIQLSTDYVFDGKQSAAYREDDPTGPLNVYGRSKLAGEEAARAANPRSLVLRTAWVYSPFGRNFVKSMMAAADEREEFRVVDDQRGSPTSGYDLANAILRIVDHWGSDQTGQGEIYHVAGNGESSWCGVAGAIMDERRALGLKAAVVHPIASSDWPTPAVRPHNSALDCSKFQRDFGMSLPPWRQSLAVVVARLAQPQ